MSCIKENIFYPYRNFIPVRIYDYQLSIIGEMLFQSYMKEQKKQGHKCDPRYVYSQMQEFMEWWKKKNRVY